MWVSFLTVGSFVLPQRDDEYCPPSHVCPARPDSWLGACDCNLPSINNYLNAKALPDVWREHESFYSRFTIGVAVIETFSSTRPTQLISYNIWSYDFHGKMWVFRIRQITLDYIIWPFIFFFVNLETAYRIILVLEIGQIQASNLVLLVTLASTRQWWCVLTEQRASVGRVAACDCSTAALQVLGWWRAQTIT